MQASSTQRTTAARRLRQATSCLLGAGLVAAGLFAAGWVGPAGATPRTGAGIAGTAGAAVSEGDHGGLGRVSLTGAVVPGVGGLPSLSAAPLLPDKDPFYQYHGSRPLAAIPPGTILARRSVDLGADGMRLPVTAEQLLYRTTGELGQPTVTVTTVIAPTGRLLARRLVAYLSFYDALGDQCDPSYTLQGGDPGAANRSQAEEEEAIIASYVLAGFTVTVPDFEGEQLDWTAGQEAGYATLDAVRATEHYLGLPADAPVGLSGYSGGSIAADWASELAPRYAPTMRLIGVAEGGLPVDYAHNLAYINGSPDWSGIIPAALVGLTRAFDVDLRPYLSPFGRRLVRQEEHGCIGSFYGAHPGLRIQQLLKKGHTDIDRIPVFVRIIDHLIMGSAPGHPSGPLFMAVGDSDGTGDGIMVTGDVEALAHEYCQDGVAVRLAVYNGFDHEESALLFEPAALRFLEARFAGVPFVSGCASIPPGNSLRPLPMPRRR